MFGEWCFFVWLGREKSRERKVQLDSLLDFSC